MMMYGRYRTASLPNESHSIFIELVLSAQARSVAIFQVPTLVWTQMTETTVVALPACEHHSAVEQLRSVIPVWQPRLETNGPHNDWYTPYMFSKTCEDTHTQTCPPLQLRIIRGFDTRPWHSKTRQASTRYPSPGCQNCQNIDTMGQFLFQHDSTYVFCLVLSRFLTRCGLTDGDFPEVEKCLDATAGGRGAVTQV